MEEKLEDYASAELEKIGEWNRLTEQSLQNAPEGSLNIRHVKGQPQYFLFKGRNKKSVYLRKNETDLKRALAQKNYDLLLLKILNEKKHALERFQKQYPKSTVDGVFAGLSLERQELVNPVKPTEEQYIKTWQETPYQGKRFLEEQAGGFYTDRGERVRSKSEVIIANTLMKMGLPYKYECPLKLGGTVVYPDFTILDPGTLKERYLEHFGMMDNPEYLDSFMRKISLYEANGILPGRKLIMTFETSARALDMRLLKNVLSGYFNL